MSAFGGKADAFACSPTCPLMTQSGRTNKSRSMAINFVIRTLACSDAQRVMELNAQLGYNEHLLEVVLGCDADGDVRIELLASCFWDERRDVVDGRLVDLRVLRRGDVSGGGPGFLSERRNGVDQFLLQPHEITCRLDHDAPQANVLPGNVVVLERLQLPARNLLVGQDLACRRVDFIEVRRADVPLQHRDVWVVRRIQMEALRKNLYQTSVRSLRVLDHRCVRLQRDVDGRDWVLRVGSPCMGEKRSEARHKRGQDV